MLAKAKKINKNINLCKEISKLTATSSETLNLSIEQELAVKTTEPKVLVIAGAGSGKTRVLTERVKYLINNGVEPSSIVAITFTNMAADEMKERLVDVQGIGDAFIGTIHAFANQIYKASGEHFQIYNDEFENEVHKYLIDKYCKFLTFSAFLIYKDMQVKCEQGLISEERVHEVLKPSQWAELQAIRGIHDYSKKNDKKNVYSKDYPEDVISVCKDRGIITFDELLYHATRYFETLDTAIEHVLVDEFQDIGRLEYSFITALNAVNYFFVGDDWQAIYGFKGGNVAIFTGLIDNVEYTKYYLQENYRNNRNIIDLAAKVIDQVPNRIHKDIISTKNTEGIIKIASKDKFDQCVSLVKETGNYKDWFILVRTNKLLVEIASMLDQSKIPYSSFKKSSLTLKEMREELEKDSVKLLTVHTAKGLESKNVILVGNFPIIEPSYKKNFDERRVMYVGITRAIDNLIVLN
jgi:DNA helicase-2/ATP-dependent DNA helicase PcrA